MPPVNSVCVSQPHKLVGIYESADIFNGDGSGQMWKARGRGGVKMAFFADVLYYEPISRDLSQNLSCKSAKPRPAAKIAASRNFKPQFVLSQP